MSKTPKDFSKMSKETQFLANYFKQEMNENTDKLIQRMDEKDKIIEDLRKDVNSLQNTVKDLEAELNKQKYELDNIKHVDNKGFIILSGPGVHKSNQSPSKIIKSTMKSKLDIDIDDNSITEATKITPRNTSRSPSATSTQLPDPLYKFKLPYEVQTEIISKLAIEKPNIYLNEALSPLKRELLKRAKEVKKALPKKIKSTYFKNGILRINEVDGQNNPVLILNDVQLDDYLKKINFTTRG